MTLWLDRDNRRGGDKRPVNHPASHESSNEPVKWRRCTISGDPMEDYRPTAEIIQPSIHLCFNQTTCLFHSSPSAAPSALGRSSHQRVVEAFPPFLLFTFRLNRSTAEVQFSDRCTPLELYLRGVPSALGTRIYLTLDRSSSFVARIRLNVSQTVNWNRVDGWMENRCRQWLPAFPLSTFDVSQFLNQEVSYPQSTTTTTTKCLFEAGGNQRECVKKDQRLNWTGDQLNWIWAFQIWVCDLFRVFAWK